MVVVFNVACERRVRMDASVDFARKRVANNLSRESGESDVVP